MSGEVRMPLVCYCGDTAPEGLDADPAIYESKILITEMTFFRPEHRRDKIHKFGHTHLDDLVERADKFQNELIILGHSARATVIVRSNRRSTSDCPSAQVARQAVVFRGTRSQA